MEEAEIHQQQPLDTGDVHLQDNPSRMPSLSGAPLLNSAEPPKLASSSPQSSSPQEDALSPSFSGMNLGHSVEWANDYNPRLKSHMLDARKRVHLIFAFGYTRDDVSSEDTTPSYSSAIRRPPPAGLDSQEVVKNSDAVENYRAFSSLKSCMRFIRRRLVQNEPLYPYWIDIMGLNAEEAKLLQSVHNLSDEITGHLMDPELPERCELMGERTVFFSLRVSREAHLETDLADFRTSSPYLFLGLEDVALTVHDREVSSWGETIDRVLNDGNIIPDISWILYAVLDTITDGLTTAVTALSEEGFLMDDLSFEVESGHFMEFQSRMKGARTRLSELRRSVPQQFGLVVKLLSNEESEFVHPDVRFYMRDVLDHLVNGIEQIEFTGDMLNQAQKNFNANARWEVNSQQRSIGNRMRRFAYLNMSFIVMLVVTGMWGMNIQVPGMLVDNLNWFISLSCVLLGILVGIYFLCSCSWRRILPKEFTR